MIAYIFTDILHSGLADGKRPISGLPMETLVFGASRAEPVGGGFFDVACDAADRRGASGEKKEMCVIGFGVDLDGSAFHAGEDPAHVCVQIRADLIGVDPFAVFGGEHQVDVDFGQ